MGTPEFAKTILNAISLKHNITLVVTQPDTYNRKTHSEQYSPCKEWAVEHNVEVFQPEKIRLDYEKVSCHMRFLPPAGRNRRRPASGYRYPGRLGL